MRSIWLVIMLMSVRLWSQTKADALFLPAPESSRAALAAMLESDISKFTLLQPNPALWSKLLAERPSTLALVFPFENGLTIELERSNPLAYDFILTATDSEGRTDTLEYDPGLHYSGRIAGKPHSLAAISIFKDQIIGVIADERLNINLGRLKSTSARVNNTYIMYRDMDMIKKPDFQCGTKDDELGDDISMPSGKGNAEPAPVCPAQIYLDCDFNLFTALGSNITATADLAIANFNIVQTIYANENIPLVISETHVWTIDDPFPNTNDILQLNAQSTYHNINGLNGDLACLLVPDAWGIGWLNGLCHNPSNGNVSGWMDTPHPFPIYSQSACTMAHELGHNFGSPHTHSCKWPGGPIDNCYPVEDGICNPGPPPVNGGTIMSYCNILGPFSLANGFGPLPGNLIRNNYQNAACLNPLPEFSYTIYPDKVIFNYLSSHANAYLWDFGDGQSSNEANPSHHYDMPGNYHVCLSASGICGAYSICHDVDITSNYCWHWQNPKPQGNTLNDVTFINAQTGWAVGDAGTILKTNNGGANWELQIPGAVDGLNGVHFIDAQHGWVVGMNGKLFNTDNGGASWKLQNSGTTESLYSVYFADNQSGWAVGTHGVILQTSDGGISWQKQIYQTTNQLNEVYFVDKQNGWAVGNSGMILKSDDGGATWLLQPSGITNSLYSVCFIDSQTGWAVGAGGKILKTVDGGAQWQIQTYGTANWFNKVHFTDNQTGWAVGGSGKIIKTTDGGVSWQFQSSPTPLALLGMYFTDNQTGWAVGFNGNILKTVNSGTNWQLQSTGSTEGLYGVHFANRQNGWAVGIGGKILKTNNGGTNWQLQFSGVNTWLYGVQFTDIQTGWAVGNSGTIIKTVDGGLHWQTQNAGIASSLKAVHFIDNQHGWIAGSEGTILNTTNGGANWQIQPTPTTNVLHDIFFADSQSGWAVGDSGIIIKTGNSGNNWEKLISGVSGTLNGVYFANLQTGWAIGDNGLILKTTDGGLSWKSKPIQLTQTLNSVHFIDTLTGWVVGNSGTILKTNDGGETWQFQGFPMTLSLNGVYFPDGQTGWTVGSGGTILAFQVVQKPVTQDITLCKGSVAPPLTATGTNLLWYDSAIGGLGSPNAPVPNTSKSDTITYYVSQSPVGIGSCIESERAAITVTVTAPTVSIVSTNTCNDDGTAVAMASGSFAPYSFNWSNGKTDAAIDHLPTGTYTVTVTDAHGCQESKTVTVESGPSPSAVITDIILPCPDHSNGHATVSATNGVTPYTFHWSNGQSGATASNLAPGAYTVTVTGNNGCSATATAVIVAAAVPVASIEGIVMPCSGNSDGLATVNVTAGIPPYSYLWSDGQTAETAIHLLAGTYVVTVTGNNGCTSTTTAEISNLTSPAAEITGIVSPCAGQSNGVVTAIAGSGAAPYSFVWNNGQTGALASGLPEGAYSVTVTDNNGCSVVNSVALVNIPVFSVELQTGPEITGLTCQSTANPLSGTPPFAFLWSDGQTGQMIDHIPDGQFSVTVTDATGCTSVQTDACISVAVKDMEEPALFSIAPNPANTFILIHVGFKKLEKVQIRLFDSLGQILFENHYDDLELIENIDLRGMPCGCYFVQVNTTSGSRSKAISIIR